MAKTTKGYGVRRLSVGQRARELEEDIAAALSARDKFTILVGNEMLGTSRHVGTFDSEADAVAYAGAEKSRTRSFATYQLWSGSARHPLGFVRDLGRGAR